jgi:hypothetical protein
MPLSRVAAAAEALPGRGQAAAERRVCSESPFDCGQGACARAQVRAAKREAAPHFIIGNEVRGKEKKTRAFFFFFDSPAANLRLLLLQSTMLKFVTITTATTFLGES